MSDLPVDLRVQVISGDSAEIGELMDNFQLVVTDADGGGVLDNLNHHLSFLQTDRLNSRQAFVSLSTRYCICTSECAVNAVSFANNIALMST